MWVNNAYPRLPRLRFGFTLVELLIVIAIISLLVSILLPALSYAKEQALKVKCQSNLNQIYTGMFMYTEDHGGYFPLSRDVGDYGDLSTAGWVYLWWPEALASYLNYPKGVERPASILDPPIYLYEENWRREMVYFCPSDQRDGGPWGSLPVMTSYGMNEFSTWWHPNYGWGGNRLDEWTKYRRHTSVASTHMLMAETNGRGLRQESTTMLSFAPRHSWSLNILYVDGHIESAKGPEQGEEFGAWWGRHGWNAHDPPYMHIGELWLENSWSQWHPDQQ